MDGTMINRTFLFETKTGKIVRDISVSAIRGGERYNAAGTVDISVNTIDNPSLRSVIDLIKYSVGVEIDGKLYGYVLDRRGSSSERRDEIDLSGIGIADMFKKRIARSEAVYSGSEDIITHEKIELANMSYGEIAARLVQHNINSVDECDLPINIPSSFAIGDKSLKAYGYELRSIADLHNQLLESGGSDIAYVLKYASSTQQTVYWDMVAGTPFLPAVGPDPIWDMTTEDSVSVLNVDEDATNKATRMWVAGKGSELTMHIADSKNAEAEVVGGYPRTEFVVSYKDIEDATTLRDTAAKKLGDNSRVVATWSTEVRGTEYPTFGSYDVGSMAWFIIPNDHVLVEGGKRRAKIMGFDYDDTASIKLVLAPIEVGSEFDETKFPRRYYKPDPIADLQEAVNEAHDRIDTLDRNAPDEISVGGTKIDKDGITIKDDLGNETKLKADGLYNGAGVPIGGGSSLSGTNIANASFMMSWLDNSNSQDVKSPSMKWEATGAPVVVNGTTLPQPSGEIALIKSGGGVTIFSLTGPWVNPNSSRTSLIMDTNGGYGIGSFSGNTVVNESYITGKNVFIGTAAIDSVVEVKSGKLKAVAIEASSMKLTGMLTVAGLDASSIESVSFQNLSTTGTVRAGGDLTATQNAAVYYDMSVGGSLTVNGTQITGGSKQFRMEHPLDSSMWITHAATESPYNGIEYWGTVVVGDDGTATVELDDYFEAIAKDDPETRAVFLTPVGSRSTFCSSEIVDGKFVVEADPGTKLKWNAKAVREFIVDGVDTLAFSAKSYK